jgi:predicted phage terminase large subunit-like protein
MRVHEFIRDDLETRLVPGASMGFVFTRYVSDDPATWFLGEDYDGRSGFIKGTDGQKWFVLNCPAQCEREDDILGRKVGEYIWPERFPESFWLPHKTVERKWSSLFQQRPAPKSGLIFKREWFDGKIIGKDEAPAFMTRVRGWDFGATSQEESATSDPSACVKMARSGSRIFVMHAWNRRETAAGIDAAISQFVRTDGPGVIVSMPQDPGQAGKDQAQRRRAIAKAAGARDVRVTPEYGGKIYRADAFASECEQGNVYLVDDKTWDIQRWIDALCDFPTGKHDDDVDAASRACNTLLERDTIRVARLAD